MPTPIFDKVTVGDVWRRVPNRSVWRVKEGPNATGHALLELLHIDGTPPIARVLRYVSKSQLIEKYERQL